MRPPACSAVWCPSPRAAPESMCVLGGDDEELGARGRRKAAADAGSSDGLFRLGTCYESGFGVDKDESEALKFYKCAPFRTRRLAPAWAAQPMRRSSVPPSPDCSLL